MIGSKIVRWLALPTRGGGTPGDHRRMLLPAGVIAVVVAVTAAIALGTGHDGSKGASAEQQCAATAEAAPVSATRQTIRSRPATPLWCATQPWSSTMSSGPLVVAMTCPAERRSRSSRSAC